MAALGRPVEAPLPVETVIQAGNSQPHSFEARPVIGCLILKAVIQGPAGIDPELTIQQR